MDAQRIVAIRTSRRLPPHTRWRRFAAAGAHAYTIMGGVLALAAVVATSGHQFDRAFLFLVLAFVVDATDGVLARRLDVTTYWPAIDGERLDALIDFVTFVMVPVFIGIAADVLPRPSVGWGSAMVVASLIRFSRRHTKEHGCFRYLPSCWNVLVFYAYYLQLPSVMVGVCVVLLIVLMFVPGRYPHPVIHESRRWHVLLGFPLLLLVLAMPTGLVSAQPWLFVSLVYPAWYGIQALVLAAKGRRSDELFARLLSLIIGNYPRLGYAS